MQLSARWRTLVQVGASWCSLMYFWFKLVQCGVVSWTLVLFGSSWCSLVQVSALLCTLVQVGAPWCKLLCFLVLVGAVWF